MPAGPPTRARIKITTIKIHMGESRAEDDEMTGADRPTPAGDRDSTDPVMPAHRLQSRQP